MSRLTRQAGTFTGEGTSSSQFTLETRDEKGEYLLYALDYAGGLLSLC